MLEQELWIAASEGNVQKVKDILEQTELLVDVNWGDAEHQRTPFYRACYFGHYELVKLMLKDNRVDVSKIQSQGFSPLNIACQNGHLEIVKELISDGRNNINLPSFDGQTPFFKASQNGHLEIIQLLLSTSRKVNVNQERNDGVTPIFMAASNGHVNVIKRILATEHEVNLEARWNVLGHTIFDQTRYSCQMDKQEWETIDDVRRRQTQCPSILEILTDYQRESAVVRKKFKKEFNLFGG